MATNESLADRLREARTAAKLSQAKLSDIAGLWTCHVGLIERGTVETPSGVVLGQLAATLGVSIDWLVSGRGSMPSEASIRTSVTNAIKRHGGVRPKRKAKRGSTRKKAA